MVERTPWEHCGNTHALANPHSGGEFGFSQIARNFRSELCASEVPSLKSGAPRVFIQGEAVSLRDALAAFVSPELLESFQVARSSGFCVDGWAWHAFFFFFFS